MRMRILFWGIVSVFRAIQEMSVQISIVILLVLLCRLLIGKVSKQACYFLWAIVAIRLLVPVMPEASFSIFNVTQYLETLVPTDGMSSDDVPLVITDITEQAPANMDMSVISGVTDNVQNVTADEAEKEEATASGIMLRLRDNRNAMIWFVGVLLLGGYGVTAYIVLKHKLRFATTSDHKIYEAGTITSPFVFGIIKPKIYLPYRLPEEARKYILLHENYHIRRKDYLIKILAFALLAVYWFHPLVWAAFYLMSLDMELSCDEQVLKGLGRDEHKAYSLLLVNLASQKQFPLPSPVSFGENDIKRRVKSILNYKQPTFWGMAAVVLFVVLLVAGCLTDAKENVIPQDSDMAEMKSYDEMTTEEIYAFAEELYAVKNPYIGDVSGNGKILGLLNAYYGVNGMEGAELQTTDMPYWITMNLTKQQDNATIWKVATVFLALTENASEFRWKMVETEDKASVYYVRTEDAEQVLGCADLKLFADSPEQIRELLDLLEEKEANIVVSQSLFSYYADAAGVPWNIANQYELRFMKDGIEYRGDKGFVKQCFYDDFDGNGMIDLIIVALSYDENDYQDIFYFYMNGEPLFSHKLSYGAVFWNITAADIDNDGAGELLFSGDTGGTGGYGFNAVFEIFKYKDGTLESMSLPHDEYCEDEAGFGIEVYTAQGEGNYTAYIPSLGESIDFSIGDAFAEELEKDIPNGTLVGAEWDGFHKLTPVWENGICYLLAEEELYLENIYQYRTNVATAKFLLYWENGWKVERVEVE